MTDSNDKENTGASGVASSDLLAFKDLPIGSTFSWDMGNKRPSTGWKKTGKLTYRHNAWSSEVEDDEISTLISQENDGVFPS